MKVFQNNPKLTSNIFVHRWLVGLDNIATNKNSGILNWILNYHILHPDVTSEKKLINDGVSFERTEAIVVTQTEKLN